MTTATMTAPVDGAAQGYAPQPPRLGTWVRFIYDIIRDNDGWTSVDTVWQQLKDKKPHTSALTKKKTEDFLYQAVYQGYVVENDGMYQIAPIGWYEQCRQKMLQKERARIKRNREAAAAEKQKRQNLLNGAGPSGDLPTRFREYVLGDVLSEQLVNVSNGSRVLVTVREVK